MSTMMVRRASVPARSNGLDQSGWPQPLACEAFQGVAGEIVREIEPHSEADPAALLIQFLVEFGSTIGGNPHFRVEDDHHRGNLYAVLVGKSSRSRKGTSEGRVRKIFENAVPDWTRNCLASGLSSGEGIIWRVRDSAGCWSKIQPTGALLDPSADAGVAEKRLLVIESEFSSALRVMAREGNTLSPVIREAWDGGNLSILTKNSPAKATGAHVSILGHITQEELLRHLTTTEMSNGFANRFLWVCTKRSKQLPEGGHFRAEEHPDLFEALRAIIEHAQQIGEVKRDSRARALWKEVYPALTRDVPGLLGSITSRAEAQVLRLSLLYALVDLSNEIGQEHLLAALAVWDYCNASAKYIFGDALGYPDADRIMRELRKSPAGLTRTEIRDLFLRHKREEEIISALSYLQELGLAYPSIEKTGGRDVERWMATR